MQAQTHAIGQADEIYSKMLSLAQMATDPIISDADRTLLSDQFNSLRDYANSIANGRFNNKLMFDPLAASTKYNVSFGQGQLKVLSNPGNQSISPYEEVDVLYNKGKMTIDVNGGNSPRAVHLVAR